MVRSLKTLLALIAVAMAVAAIFVFVFPAHGKTRTPNGLDGNCASLRTLEQQWRGAVLTPEQQAIKASLVEWYRANCTTRAAVKEPQR